MPVVKTLTRKLAALRQPDEHLTSQEPSDLAAHSSNARRQRCPSCGGVLDTPRAFCPGCLKRYDAQTPHRYQYRPERSRFVDVF